MADALQQTAGDDRIMSSSYDLSDLTFFRGVIDNLLEEIAGTGGHLLEPANRETLRLRLSAAIFKCAEGGERDADRLRRHVMATVAARRSGEPLNTLTRAFATAASSSGG